jgi:hypothetical protein
MQKIKKNLRIRLKHFLRYMNFFRQNIAPLLVVLVFAVALVVVSARIFLPGDMAQPAPIEEVAQQPAKSATAMTPNAVADLPPTLSLLVKGLPEDLALSAQL